MLVGFREDQSRGDPLTDIIPPSARKAVYASYALVGLVLGAIQVGFSAADENQPTWMVVALAVYAFIGTAIGATAASNVEPPPPPGPA